MTGASMQLTDANHIRGYVACLDRMWPYVETLEAELKETRAAVHALNETVEFLTEPVSEDAPPWDVEDCLRVVAAEAAGYKRGMEDGCAQNAGELAKTKKKLAGVQRELVSARRWFGAVVGMNLLSAAYVVAERWL